MTHPRATERQKIDALLYRHNITCAVCKERILPGDRIDWDHIHSLCLGGEHKHSNLRPLHHECHKHKTRRDVKDNAKVKRIRGETCNGPKKRIDNRGFDKRYKRKVNGTVERRE